MKISSVISKIKSTIKENSIEEDSMFISHSNIPNGFSLESERENIKAIFTDQILKPLVKRNDDFHAHRFINKGHKVILELKYLTLIGDIIVHITNGSALRSDNDFYDIEVKIIDGATTSNCYYFTGKDNLLHDRFGIVNAIESLCKAFEVLHKFNKHKFIAEVDK